MLKTLVEQTQCLSGFSTRDDRVRQGMQLKRKSIRTLRHEREWLHCVPPPSSSGAIPEQAQTGSGTRVAARRTPHALLRWPLALQLLKETIRGP